MIALLSSCLASGIEASSGKTTVCREDQTIDPILIPYLRADTNPFCMNGGTCKSDFESVPDFPCVCHNGTSGPHCEFSNKKQVPKCKLICFHDGVCQVGIRSFMDLSGLPATEDYNYCRCKPGFYGDQCGVKGVQCGSTVCLNGGKCIQIENGDGTVTDNCDCTSAKGKDGQQFAGRYCHLSKTSDCYDHNAAEPSNFCVNGGTCNLDPRLGCDCPDGFFGSLCEFGGADDNWKCNMDCGDHGFCRKGAKDTSFIDNFDFDDRRLTARFNQEFEHCVCEPGWSGLNCDVKMDICPGRSMICLHGSTCILSNITGEFECDCNTANEGGLKYAGKYCQYHSTAYCTPDGLKPKTRSSDAFCTNNGKCRDYVPRNGLHPGCSCEEHFKGDHCEKLADEKEVKSSKPEEDQTSSKAVPVVVALIICLFVCIVLVFLWQRRQRRQNNAYNRDIQSGSRSFQFGSFLDFTTRRGNRSKVAPFHQNLDSIDDESLNSGKPFEDKLDCSSSRLSHDSDHDQFHDEIRYNEDTKDFELPPLQTQHTSDSIGVGGLRSESLRGIVKSDLSLYSFPSNSIPCPSYSFSMTHEQEQHLNTNDIEDIVQKRRRIFNTASMAMNDRLIVGDSSHMSSEVESMSTIESNSESVHKITSNVKAKGVQILTSDYSLSDESLMEQGSMFDSNEGFRLTYTAKEGTFTNSGPARKMAAAPETRPGNSQAPKSVSFEVEAMTSKKKKKERRLAKRANRTVNAERSDHYKAIGASAEIKSTKYPWRGERRDRDAQTISPSLELERASTDQDHSEQISAHKASCEMDSGEEATTSNTSAIHDESTQSTGELVQTQDSSILSTDYDATNDEQSSNPTDSTQTSKSSKTSRSTMASRQVKDSSIKCLPSDISKVKKGSKSKTSTGSKNKSAKSSKSKSKGKQELEQDKLEADEKQSDENEKSTASESKNEGSLVKAANGKDQKKTTSKTEGGNKGKGLSVIEPGFVIASTAAQSVQSKLTQIGLSSSWSSKSDTRIKAADIFGDSSVSSLSEAAANKQKSAAAAAAAAATNSSSSAGTGGGLQKSPASTPATAGPLKKIDPWADGGNGKKNTYSSVADVVASSGSMEISRSGSSSATTTEAWEFAGKSRGLDVV
ncbi:hypothetical protein ACA910_000547 [Epithemia clementina (nom. ined.)]